MIGAGFRVIRLGPLVATCVFLGGCLHDADPRSPAEHLSVSGGSAHRARSVMREYGCTSCHTIPGVAGANSLVGPPLTGFARRRYIAGRVRNSGEELVRWILNPQEIKPGTAMPDVGVSAQEARDIAAYLYTLR